jgi:Family of unknown function (DUF5686)
MFCKKKLSFFLFLSMLFAKTNAIAQNLPLEAKQIIQKTILFKKINKPNNYEFTTYNKLIVSANPDSIVGRIDSVFTIKKGKRVFKKIDSSDYNFKKIITKQHLYQTEKISKFQVQNNKQKEKILATKMAGFKEPIFEYFALQLQPFSVYDNYFSLVEKEYINPISDKGIQKYKFIFLENTFLENRKVYKIEFEPIKKSNTDQLKGVFYIDEEKFSIAKAELKVLGLIEVKCNYVFEFNKEIQNWFPIKTNLCIKKGTNNSPIKLFGQTITFDGNDATVNPEGRKYASDFLEIKSNTKFFEPKFNIKTRIRKADIAIEITKSAIAKKEALWYTYFNDSIDVRSNPTYISLDSLIKSRKFENKIKIGRKVLKGYYPVGFFDVDLRYLISFNNYEGFRLGIGGVTNEKLLKNYKLEGYYIYGTKDGFFKGFVSNSYRINNEFDTWLGFSYKDDVSEIASTSFEVDKRNFTLYNPRPFNISTFYNHVTWRGFLETKIIPKTEAILQITQTDVIPRFNYQFNVNDNLFSRFKASTITFSLQWNPLSKYMQTPSKDIEIEKNFPKFTFQFAKTIPKLWENNFNYTKVDFRFDYQKTFNSNHKLLFLFEGGYGFGDIPITNVYNHSPNSISKDQFLKRITFAGKDGFETMFYNEFFSNKYVFLQLEHQFPRLEISKRIKPVFSLITKYGLGGLNNVDQHKNIIFKTLENGYFESGFEINKIYRGLGFVAFYRYGSNRLSRLEDNIALKLSLQIDLGFNN